MYLFKTLAAFALALTGVQAQVSADQMVMNIESITVISAQTTVIAQSISIPNFFNTAPQLINNFRQIIQLATNDASSTSSGKAKLHSSKHNTLRARQSSPPYTQAKQQEICDAFRQFVHVHQALLAQVIGQYGLLSLTPFTQPIGQVLRTLEGAVDTLAFGIIDTVPTCAGEATSNKNSLDQTLEQAVNRYS